MKKTTLSITLLALTTFAFHSKASENHSNLSNHQSSITPSITFEEYLVNEGLDNAVDNSITPTPQIAAIKTLDLSNKGLTDLDGIEHFTGLEQLFAINNHLTHIDLSQNTNLKHLSLKENDLTSLDLSANTQLKELYACANDFTSIDLSNNTQLTNIGIKYNKLTSLDISNNPLVELLEVHSSSNLQSINLGTNSNLKYLFASQSNLNNIDLSGSLNLIELHLNNNQMSGLLNLESHVDLKIVNLCGNNLQGLTECSYTNTNLPILPPTPTGSITTLEEYVVSIGLDHAVDGNIPTTPEITNMKVLEISNIGIVDMTGIDSFTSLEELHAAHNKITSLDVSNNSALQVLNVVGNQITDLNVTNLTLLEGLYARSNKISSIDLSTNIALKEISLKYNSLLSLDISAINNVEYLEVVANEIMTDLIIGNQPNLTTLYGHCNMFTNVDVSGALNLKVLRLQHNKLTGTIDLSSHDKLEQVVLFDNQLEKINLKNGNNGIILTSEFNVKTNPNLTCVVVDDETISSTNWLNLDDASVFTEDITCGVALPPATLDAISGIEIRSGQIVIPNDVDRIVVRAGLTIVDNKNLSGIYLVTFIKNNGSTYTRLVFVL